jgi:hypothetical protein
MAADMHEGGTRRGGRWHPLIWAVAAGLLTLPAIAMRFPGSGVDWTASDFVVMGALFALACGAYELAARLPGTRLTRAAFAVAVLGGFFQIWVNLAVGLVGDGDNPASLMFLGVPAVALLGALIARGRPAGMARAMLATAAVHAGVGVAAAIAGWGEPHDGPLRVAAITAFFMRPWLASAALFRWSAAAPSR